MIDRTSSLTNPTGTPPRKGLLGMRIGWEVVFTEAFKQDFERLPRQVREKLDHQLGFLRTDPFQPNPNAKPLKNNGGKQSRYRLRVGNYRLVYRILADSNKVILILFKKRDEVYRKPGGDSPIAGIASTLFPQPQSSPNPAPPERHPAGEFDEPPVEIEEVIFIDADELVLLRIPDEFREEVLSIKNFSELESSELPPHIRNRISDYITNPNQTHIGRLYTLEPDDDFEAVARKPLADFLLSPDPQQRLVIDKPLDGGPFLVRGGPGTGKTLIGLYRLKRLLQERTTETLFDERKPVFMFLSYTNSLVNTSAELFKSIFSTDTVEIVFSTLDKIVAEHLSDYYRSRGLGLRDAMLKGTLELWLRNKVLKAMKHGDKTDVEAASYIEERLGVPLLMEEITNLIEAEDIGEIDQYIAFQRKGRKTALQQPARRAIWAAYAGFHRICEKEHKFTWPGLRLKFLHLLEKGWTPDQRADCLVIDEAQDMSVVALRIVTHLVRDPRFLLLLADSGQSIFNKAPTWKNVSASLRFHRGNSIILAKSYRMTQQLSKALQPLRNDADVDSDDPIRTTSGVFSGEKPAWIKAPSYRQSQETARIASDLVNRQGVGPGQIAVILRNLNTVSGYKEAVISDLKAANLSVDVFSKSDSLDLRGDAVHIITAHSAKGLEFPFVIVPYVSDQMYPFMGARPDTKDQNEIDEWAAEDQRLLYVALSRAAYRLWMISDSSDPSRFLDVLQSSDWCVEGNDV